MRLVSLLFLPLLLATAAPSSHQSKPEAPVRVADLRVGLVQDFDNPPRNFWQGLGQAGIVQLRLGHVTGVLLPFAGGGLTSEQLPIRFARFRSALGSTQAFDGRGCTPAPGRIATWFELEAFEQLAADPRQVATWVTRGVRVFALAGLTDSALATSAIPAGNERVLGLTPAGRAVTEEVMKAGGLVDIANLSDTAILEVLDLARARHVPVIATRASARSVRRRAGSLTDWQLLGVAQSGGVIALSFDRDLIGDGSNADMGDVLQQLDHLRRVAGPDAVAIASGYETGSIPALPLESAARYPRLVEALAARGMTGAQIQKLLHENAERVLCGVRSPATNGG